MATFDDLSTIDIRKDESFRVVKTKSFDTLLLLSNNNQLINSIINKYSGNQIIVGAAQSGNIFPNRNVYGLQQQIVPQNQFIGYNVFKQNITSYVYSLVPAMWYVSDIYLSNPNATNFPKLFMSSYGPNLVNYFTSDGSGFFNQAIMMEYTPGKGWKNLIGHLDSIKPYQGFDTTFSVV